MLFPFCISGKKYKMLFALCIGICKKSLVRKAILRNTMQIRIMHFIFAHCKEGPQALPISLTQLITKPCFVMC